MSSVWIPIRSLSTVHAHAMPLSRCSTVWYSSKDGDAL